MTKFLKEWEGMKYVATDAVSDYYECMVDEKYGIFMFARKKQDVIGRAAYDVWVARFRACGH